MNDPLVRSLDRHEVRGDARDAVLGWAFRAKLATATLALVDAGLAEVVGWDDDEPIFRISEQGSEHLQRQLLPAPAPNE